MVEKKRPGISTLKKISGVQKKSGINPRSKKKFLIKISTANLKLESILYTYS